MKQIKSSYRLLVIAVCIHVLWFVLALYFKGIYLADSLNYLDQAFNLAHYGSWYSEDWNAPLIMDYFSFRPPLYGLFLATCKLITSSDYFILLVQNLLSIFNTLLVYRICTSLGLNAKTIVRVLILALLFFPTQLIMANMVMSEVFFQTLILLLFYQCLLYYTKPSWTSSFLISLLLSLLLLTKPVSILLSLVVFCWIVYVAAKNQKWIILSCALLVPLTFHAICLQQKHQTGYYHYCSLKPITQWRYNARYTLANKFGENYAEQFYDSTNTILAHQADYKNRYELMQQIGDSVLKEYPVVFAKLYVKGIVVFMLDPGRYDLFSFFKIEDTEFRGLLYEVTSKGFSAIKTFLSKAPVFPLVILFFSFLWNIVVIVGFFLFLFKSQAPKYLKVLIFLFVGYIAATSGLLGVARYRTAVYPELMIALVFAFEFIKSLRKRSTV